MSMPLDIDGDRKNSATRASGNDASNERARDGVEEPRCASEHVTAIAAETERIADR
jgi:hypothetical protein